MADYPGAIYSPRTKENKPGVVYTPAKKTIGYAEDVVKLDAEVVAIEERLGINFQKGYSSKARAYRSGTHQAFPNATWTKVQLNTETYDVDGEFDHVTNHRFLVTTTGYYVILASIGTSNFPDQSNLYTAIYKNGVVMAQGKIQCGGINSMGVNTVDIAYLEAGDFIELWGYQDSGGAEEILKYGSWTFMSIHRVS